MSKESHARSVLKGITWRIIATTTTFVISYLLISLGVEQEASSSKALEMAGWIAGLEFFIKILLYYGHERIWQLAPRGTIRRWFGEGERDSPSDDR